MTDNERAFLALIEWSEGTHRATNPYRCCYGYNHPIQNLLRHPAEPGAPGEPPEWRGERLPDAMCRAAGYKPGCVSTAAGRHQLILPTWLRAKRALKLWNFQPESQDAAALWLVGTCRALEDVNAGRIADAVRKCKSEWASLPGAGVGQPERKLQDLLAAYQRAGGAFA